jgi:hypothetical protein
METVSVTLPGGHWMDGVCQREAELRPVCGDDEAFLLDAGESLRPVQKTTALLARCLTRLGPAREMTLDIVRSLTAGDREALLLHLRRLTLGDRLQGVLACPDPSCGRKMDLELKVGELLLAPYAERREHYEVAIAGERSAYQVRFRLPTGADLEATSAVAATDPRRAANQVLHRSVEAVRRDDGQPVDGLPPAVVAALPARMSELDPQAELNLTLSCPECGLAFSALFDTASYFFQELASGVERLYRDVHLLAFHYHWSEAEIMRMTPRKRQRYLGLLSDALGQ